MPARASGEGVTVGAFVALTVAGFRRWSTYRQATAAAAFTNTVFGFLKCSVLLAVLGAQGEVRGYDADQLTGFVWFGQGLLGVVLFWGWTELADRVRSGDVAADLLRPVGLLGTYLAGDLGRAGHAVLTRVVVPVAVGAAVFGVHVPRHPVTWLLAVPTVLLAVLVSFGVRYVVNLTAFWLLDVRGAIVLQTVLTGALSGLYVPVSFFPGAVRAVAWATPFPWMFQAPLDVLVERGGPAHSAALVGGQLAAAAAVLGLAAAVQRAAVRTLVVQGG